jgi:hypothetical protein
MVGPRLNSLLSSLFATLGLTQSVNRYMCMVDIRSHGSKQVHRQYFNQLKNSQYQQDQQDQQEAGLRRHPGAAEQLIV